MFRIIVHPAFGHHGKRLHGKFEARLEGHTQPLCISRAPLLDSARALLDRGADPADTITMRHVGSPHDAMRATIGGAAKLTVRENEKDGPRFVRWEAFSQRRVDAPMRFDGRQAPDTGQAAERIHAGGAP